MPQPIEPSPGLLEEAVRVGFYLLSQPVSLLLLAAVLGSILLWLTYHRVYADAPPGPGAGWRSCVIMGGHAWRWPPHDPAPGVDVGLECPRCGARKIEHCTPQRHWAERHS